MYASREYVLAQMKLVRENVDSWVRELESKDLPEGISVEMMDHIPNEQFRAELALMGASLHAMATTS